MKLFKAITQAIIGCLLITSSWIIGEQERKYSADKHYFCTPSDAKHYHLLKNLIGSIHHVEFDKLGEIAVFDLGLERSQVQELNRMQKVKVYDVEMTHPDLLTYFTTAPNGRRVRGYFAWKPVMIKQSLDMFPHVLYMDAGTTVLKPLDDLFQYIQEQGYFLESCTKGATCNIANRITKKVLKEIVYKLNPEMQDYLLAEETTEIDAGLQGFSAFSPIVKNYVLPIYEHTRHMDLFEDDGSAIYGYGAGRHDQILFSIYAHTLGLIIHPEGHISLPLSTGTKQIHIHWDSAYVTPETVIYRSRHDIHFQGGKTQYIKYH
ncbi:MAG TPA: hypothetical protein VFF04_05270 [Candidatus Babeliales bacterium]|nr:hypothetical protein [Candidatus Babeliales bacterium]